MCLCDTLHILFDTIQVIFWSKSYDIWYTSSVPVIQITSFVILFSMQYDTVHLSHLNYTIYIFYNLILFMYRYDPIHVPFDTFHVLEWSKSCEYWYTSGLHVIQITFIVILFSCICDIVHVANMIHDIYIYWNLILWRCLCDTNHMMFDTNHVILWYNSYDVWCKSCNTLIQLTFEYDTIQVH